MSSCGCKELLAGREGHTWIKYTYNLCERTGKESPCNDIRETDGFYRDRATPRLMPCPVCQGIDDARVGYEQKVQEAKQFWQPVYVSVVQYS
jgi:hypothetical protein